MSCFDFTLPRLTKLRCICEECMWVMRRNAGATNSSHTIEVIAVHRDLLRKQTQQISPLIKQRSYKTPGISSRWHQLLCHRYSHLLMRLLEPLPSLSPDPRQSPRATPKASSDFWGYVSARWKPRLLWLIPTASHMLRLTAPAENMYTPSLSPVCDLHSGAHVQRESLQVWENLPTDSTPATASEPLLGLILASYTLYIYVCTWLLPKHKACSWLMLLSLCPPLSLATNNACPVP